MSITESSGVSIPRFFSLEQSISVRALGTHLICDHFTKGNTSDLYFRFHGLLSSARNLSNLRPLDEKKLIEPFFECSTCYGVLGTYRNSDHSETKSSCKPLSSGG